MSAMDVTDQNFETEVLKDSGLVLVDFWAEWCGPCKMLTPIIEEIANEKAGSLKVVKVNVDDHQEAPSQYGVKSIPTLMLFKGGQLIGSKTGVQPKSTLVEWIDSHTV
jgi:thioredoxin 1